MTGYGVTEDVAFSCCASRVFARKLAASGKHDDFADLIAAARHIWWSETGVPEWLAAFAAHPKIGDAKAVESKPGAFAEFSRGEQAAAAQTNTGEVAEELRLWNKRYAEKFGHIFIIFARGRSAPEILAALKERYNRLPHEELQTAAQEQMKITELRLGNVFGKSAEQEMLAKMQRRADQVGLSLETRVLCLHAPQSAQLVPQPFAADPQPGCRSACQWAPAVSHHNPCPGHSAWDACQGSDHHAVESRGEQQAVGKGVRRSDQ
jgi:OHCU decarboxylase